MLDFLRITVGKKSQKKTTTTGLDVFYTTLVNYGRKNYQPLRLIGFIPINSSISSIIISGDSVLLRPSPPVSKARSGRLRRQIRSLVWPQLSHPQTPNGNLTKNCENAEDDFFWRHCWSSICFSKVGIPTDFFKGIWFTWCFFAAKKHNFLQCLHKAMSPHHLQTQFGNQERPQKVELFFFAWFQA